MLLILEIVFLIVLIGLPIIATVLYVVELNGNVLVFYSYFYWWYLVLLLYLIYRLKLKAVFFIRSALVLFIIGAFCGAFGFEMFSELILRMSFVHLLIGVIKQLMVLSHSDHTPKDG